MEPWSVADFKPHLGMFSALVILRTTAGGQEWWLTSVYDPTRDEDKPLFLDELHTVRGTRDGPWILCGDFNMIYRVADKNNDRLDHHCMGQFRRLLEDLVLKELHLCGRLYTWSNEEVSSYPRID
jgi:hypothetical protein